MSQSARRLPALLLMSLGLVTAVALGGHALAQGTGGGSGTTADPAPGNPTARPTPVLPPAPVEPPPRADAITLSPVVIPVGKWPEGIASDGRYLWVAESGSRRIAKVDQRRGRIVSRVKVGRLPVQMMALTDGRILSLVHTDKKLWQQPTPKGKGRTLARIGDCPVSMTGDSAGIWVATYVNCTGDKSKIFEIDPRTGKTRRRFDLQDGAFDISSNDQAVFVISTFRQDSTLTAIKKATGEIRRRPLQGARYHHIRATRGQLVAAGAVGDAGIVASLRQANGPKVTLPRPVAALAMDDTHVVAIDDTGVIHVFAAKGLAKLRTITTDYGTYRPQTALIDGFRLTITTHRGQGQNGSILMIDGWRP